ncbi:MAG TPA: alpha/beta hydrolase [Thermoanaerobaculia bacterium]|nr:alpha/beta hydrolase [Thermoanaerobaculia bacterium]
MSNNRQQSDATIAAVAGASLLLTTLEVARRLFRRSQVFLPEREPLRSWSPSDYGISSAAVEDIFIETHDGERLHAWYCRSDEPVGSMLYCHGSRGNITTTADVIPHMLASGINVLLFDYRGYGKSSGFPTTRGLILDGLAAADLHEKIRPADLPSVAYGYSLGGPIAADVARRVGFDGMILQSTFTNLSDAARVMFPKIPLHYIAGNPYNTLRAIASLAIPLLIVHGEADDVCPPWMAESLFRNCSERKELLLVPGASHCDVYSIAPDLVSETIRGFITRLPPSQRDGNGRVHEVSHYDRLFRALRLFTRRFSDPDPLS